MREESVCLFCCVYGYWFEGEGISIKDFCLILGCFSPPPSVSTFHAYFSFQYCTSATLGRSLNPLGTDVLYGWAQRGETEGEGAKVFSFSAPVDPTRRLMAVSCFAVRYLEEEEKRSGRRDKLCIKISPDNRRSPAENTSQ